LESSVPARGGHLAAGRSWAATLRGRTPDCSGSSANRGAEPNDRPCSPPPRGSLHGLGASWEARVFVRSVRQPASC